MEDQNAATTPTKYSMRSRHSSAGLDSPSNGKPAQQAVPRAASDSKLKFSFGDVSGANTVPPPVVPPQTFIPPTPPAPDAVNSGSGGDHASLKVKLKFAGARVATASALTASGNTIVAPPEQQTDNFTTPIKMEPNHSHSAATTPNLIPPSTPSSAARTRTRNNTSNSKPMQMKPPQVKHKLKREVDAASLPSEAPSSSAQPSESSQDEGNTNAEENSSSQAKAKNTKRGRARRQNVNRINAAEIDGDEEDYYSGTSNASQFWRGVEEYRAPFKPSDLELFNPELHCLPADSPALKMPALGVHYREQWIAEEQKEHRDQNLSLDVSGTRAASRRAQSLIRDQSHGDSLDKDAIKESAKDLKEEEPQNQLRLGTFTSRLIASLVQDTEVPQGFFAKTLADSAADFIDDDIRLGEGVSGPPQFAVHEKALSDVEIRLQKELKDLGLLLSVSALSAAVDQKKTAVPEVEREDEIVSEIKKLQQELVDLYRANANKGATFLPRIKERMETYDKEVAEKLSIDSRESAAKKEFAIIKKRKKPVKEKEGPPKKKARTSSKSLPTAAPPPPEEDDVDPFRDAEMSEAPIAEKGEGNDDNALDDENEEVEDGEGVPDEKGDLGYESGSLRSDFGGPDPQGDEGVGTPHGFGHDDSQLAGDPMEVDQAAPPSDLAASMDIPDLGV